MTDCNRSGLHSIEVWHRHYTTYMYVYSTYMHICESLSIKIDRYSHTHSARHGTRSEMKWEKQRAHTKKIRTTTMSMTTIEQEKERQIERQKGRERTRVEQQKIYYYFSFSIIQLFGRTEYLCCSVKETHRILFPFLFFSFFPSN